MRKIKILLVILCVTLSFAMNSQNKVAHVNTEDVIMLMPERKVAQKELEGLAKTEGDIIENMYAEFQTKQSLYQAQADEQTDEENTIRGKEIQDILVSIRNYEANAQQNFQKKEVELMAPITQKIMDAINKIARAQGLEYVFQFPMQGLLVAKGKDITEDVKTELGI